MSDFRIVGALVSGSIVSLLCVLVAAQEIEAQTPSPTIGAETICQRPLQQAGGGQTLTLNDLRVTLPSNFSYIWTPLTIEPQGPALTVCVRELNSQTTISARTGQELSRRVNDPSAGPVLDEIVRSALVVSQPRPTPVAEPIPTTTMPSTFRAPNTGDGGLRLH
jgi:hypothetical protein